MKNRKRKSGPVEAGDRKRVAVRRRTVKAAQLAKTRRKGEARNAARALGLRVSARKRKIEPTVHKPVAKPNTSIPAQSKP
jgi:hypothetical protein